LTSRTIRRAASAGNAKGKIGYPRKIQSSLECLLVNRAGGGTGKEAEETAGKKGRGERAHPGRPPDINARIDALEEAVSQIRSQLSDLQAKIEPSGTRKPARQLDEVLQKLKAHQHDREDGRAYILEKKEL
jgi:hypothetical protein